MKVISTTIPDVLIIEPKVFGDERGFFYESFNAKIFREVTGLDVQFVQDNHSKSERMCCVGCTIKSSIHRASWFGSLQARSLMFAVDLRRPSPKATAA